MNERGPAPSVGSAVPRVDGPVKVSGLALYAADFPLPNLCHGVIVQSTIARGRIARVDDRAARSMPGVVAVMTHENAPRLPERGRRAVEAAGCPGVESADGRELSLLQAPDVRYNGEPVAVVVAETLEQATAAAAAVRFEYERKPAIVDFRVARHDTHCPDESGRSPADQDWGDPAAALAAAEVVVDATYATPMEHHNAIEPHAATAHWEGEDLALYDTTQHVRGTQETVAATFGIGPERVRVVSRFVGGGFGGKGSVWSHVVLAAMAAREVGRPVRIALERGQLYGPVGGRPCTEQHLVLGAGRDGRLVAIRHDSISHTSRFEDYLEPASQPSRAMYACPNGATSNRLAPLDVGTPTFQRAPGESTGNFALESAMDELAQALGMDPLELRRLNHADREPSSGRAWSSKRLLECYAQGARRFGWERRARAPRSMRDGSWQVGWGVATASYPAHLEAARALARRLPDGTYVVRSGTQDLGTGTYTVMTQVAADALGVPVDAVRFELGDSRHPVAPISGGSMTVASVGPAVVAACEALRAKVEALRRANPAADPGLVEAHGEARPRTHDEQSQALACRSFGAVFAEVLVDADLGVVRVPRIVGCYSVGRVINPATARSQVEGGIVMGVGQALLEESRLDLASGRIANANLAEYHVPVNADIGILDVSFVEEDDTRFNSLGARGVGEIGITGVAAAIANAVFHATGRRIRELPITLDKLL